MDEKRKKLAKRKGGGELIAEMEGRTMVDRDCHPK